MRILDRIRRFFASSTTNPSQWMIDWIRGTPNDSGIDFNRQTPLRYAPIWYAVNKIAGHVGYLPLILYRRTAEGGSEPALDHPAYRLMKRRPNSDIRSHTFRETLQAHALLYGNGRALIERDGRGQPTELIPMLPDRFKAVEVVGGRKWHIWLDDDQNTIPIPDSEVLHIAGLGYDGLQGYSLLELARNSWGLGLQAERTSALSFRRNAVPALALEPVRGSFRDQADAKQYLQKWEEFHEGGGRVALLRDGMKAHVLSVPARDAEWIAQRQFQRQEVALWFLIEAILGDDSSISYNSLEMRNLAYLTNCLATWLCRWEQEADEKLLTTEQLRRDSHFFRFKTAAILRGTTKERYQVYAIGRQIEVLSVNDIRKMEDMDPIPGGDEYRNPNINPAEAAAAGGEENETAGQERELRAAILGMMLREQGNGNGNARNIHL